MKFRNQLKKPTKSIGHETNRLLFYIGLNPFCCKFAMLLLLPLEMHSKFKKKKITKSTCNCLLFIKVKLYPMLKLSTFIQQN